MRVIPLRQIREVPSPEDLQQRRLGPEYFVSRERRLPKGYWTAPPEATRLLWQELSREFQACCTAARTDSFAYFQRRDGLAISLDRLEPSFDIEHHASVAPGESDGRPEEGESTGHRFAPSLRRVKARSTDEHRTGRGLPLARELLAEIFQSLDNIERVRKRRVCRLWEAMLDSNAIGKHLWISCRHPFHRYRSEEAEQFLLAACMLKCVISATDTIILEDSSELCSWSRGVYEVVLILLQQRRIKTLVFSRCDFSDYDYELRHYMRLINHRWSELEASCRVVVWRDCEWSLPETSALVAFAKFCLRDAAAQRLLQLWDVHERSLVERELVDLPRLAEWVACCVRTKDTNKCEGIISVLNEFMGADPRTAQCSAHQKWTTENLANLNVFRLTKLAQVALYGRIGDSM
ncbi:uncharacterized protein LOC129591003 [Paramacrobiotus metropolitanus]|uniref:uncharacterized protein LOC129591003 n=1 Tax=Paramacrobiotus metropolitanus TaxID=2943436 RepID=UPI0024463E40|nr:uncharacterized protein LOC129591003 [Paramacrobiotus metropolitanus]